jgi:hypothetical protein
VDKSADETGRITSEMWACFDGTGVLAIDAPHQGTSNEATRCFGSTGTGGTYAGHFGSGALDWRRIGRSRRRLVRRCTYGPLATDKAASAFAQMPKDLKQE